MKKTTITTLTAMAVSVLFLVSGSLKAQGNLKQGSGNTQVSSKTVEGTILSKNGTTVRMQTKEQTNVLPARDTQGILSKYFETSLGNINTTGWMEIGKMKVLSADRTVFTFQLVEELSKITKNGVPVNHFVPGTVVKFNWSE